MPTLSSLARFLGFDRPFVHDDQLTLRDHLALERTRLANERTFMSYLRSALYLLVGGMTLIQIKAYPELDWVGIVSIFLSVLMTVIGSVRFIRLRREMNSYYKQALEHKARKRQQRSV